MAPTSTRWHVCAHARRPSSSSNRQGPVVRHRMRWPRAKAERSARNILWCQWVWPDNAGMGGTGEGEEDDAVNVIERLAARFPTLDREHITTVVREEHDSLNDARVRDFIPVLVEHAATERLRLEAHPVMSPTTESGTATPLVEPSSLDPMEVQRRLQPPGGPFLGNAGGG